MAASTTSLCVVGETVVTEAEIDDLFQEETEEGIEEYFMVHQSRLAEQRRIQSRSLGSSTATTQVQPELLRELGLLNGDRPQARSNPTNSTSGVCGPQRAVLTPDQAAG